MEEKEEKSFISAISHGSSHTSSVDMSTKAQADEEDWQEEGEDLSSILLQNLKTTLN